MWVVCKRRKIEYTNNKRKLPDNNYNTSKRPRFYQQVNYNKRKIDNICVVSQKRQKIYHDFYSCIYHKERYICDMYECDGIREKKYINEEHMPYII